MRIKQQTASGSSWSAPPNATTTNGSLFFEQPSSTSQSRAPATSTTPSNNGATPHTEEEEITFLLSMFQLDEAIDKEVVQLIFLENDKDWSKTMEQLLQLSENGRIPSAALQPQESIPSESTTASASGSSSTQEEEPEVIEDTEAEDEKVALELQRQFDEEQAQEAILLATQEKKSKEEQLRQELPSYVIIKPAKSKPKQGGKKKKNNNNKPKQNKAASGSSPSTAAAAQATTPASGIATDEGLETLCAVFPQLDREMIQSQLIALNYDFQATYEQIAVQIGMVAPANAKKKPASAPGGKKKFVARPDLLGTASSPNRWNQQTVVNKITDNLSIEKLKKMFREYKTADGSLIPEELIEKVYKQEGQLSKAIPKLKQMFPHHKLGEAGGVNQTLIDAPLKITPTTSGYIINPQEEPKYEPSQSGLSRKQIQFEKLQHDYNYYRTEAQASAEARNQYFKLALQAYIRGDNTTAKELSEKGKQAEKLYKEYNEIAAQLIFRERNKQSSHLFTIDLHGLHVEEALTIIQQQLSSMKEKNSRTMRIITGVGKHSAGGQAKLRPAVREFLAERSNLLKFKEPHDGVFIVFGIWK